MLNRKQKKTSEKNKKLRSPQKSPNVKKSLEKHRLRFWQPITSLPLWKNVLGVIAAIFTICGFFFEIFYDTVPDIKPDQAISTVWADLPLSARNPSRIFQMHNVKVFCRVENVTWRGEGKRHFRMISQDFEKIAVNIPTEIEPGSPINFPCNISRDITASATDGLQYPIALIRLRIRLTYETAFGIKFARQKTSSLFTWRAVSGGYQWLEGDVSDRYQPM
jgi:hypothetical protein